MRKPFVLGLILCLILASVGFASTGKSSNAQYHRMHGEIASTDATAQTFTVKHGKDASTFKTDNAPLDRAAVLAQNPHHQPETSRQSLRAALPCPGAEGPEGSLKHLRLVRRRLPRGVGEAEVGRPDGGVSGRELPAGVAVCGRLTPRSLPSASKRVELSGEQQRGGLSLGVRGGEAQPGGRRWGSPSSEESRAWQGLMPYVEVVIQGPWGPEQVPPSRGVFPGGTSGTQQKLLGRV